MYQPIAQGLASLGRGQDKMLVHMTPGEVEGLQKIAMAHGGSLTINPQTGLPEAGFLSSILPMVAGIGLNAAFPGLGAAGTGLLVGGLGAAATGSLSQGLMMGLGAYGGAGLGEGLAGIGGGVDSLVEQAAANPEAVMSPDEYSKFLTSQAPSTVATGTPTQAGFMDRMSQMGRGLSRAFNDPSKLMNKDTLKYGAAAMAPALPDLAQQPTLKPLSGASGQTMPYKQYGYNLVQNPNYGKPGHQGEPPFIQQGFTPMAEGGIVPNQQTMYPMSNIMAVGTPSGAVTPTRSDVVTGFDAAVNTQTGEPIKAFAEGGSTKYRQAADAAASSAVPNQYATAAYLNQLGSLLGGGAAPSAMNSGLGSFTLPGADAVTGPAQGPTMPAPTYDAAKGWVGPSGAPVGMSQSPALSPTSPAPTTPAPSITPVTGASGYTYDPVSKTFTPPASSPVVTNPVPLTPGAGLHMEDGGYFDNMGTPYFQDETTGEWKASQPGQNGDKAGGPIRAKYAAGGMASLPEYAAGGKLLRGAGDGMSDSIPAVIRGPKPQRAALADGEFVVPADVVSHLGNGSTDAGAKRLYAMMDKVRQARTGNKKQGRQINPERYMPA